MGEVVSIHRGDDKNREPITEEPDKRWRVYKRKGDGVEAYFAYCGISQEPDVELIAPFDSENEAVQEVIRLSGWDQPPPSPELKDEI